MSRIKAYLEKGSQNRRHRRDRIKAAVKKMSKERQDQKKQEATSTNKNTKRKTTIRIKAWTTRTLMKTDGV